MSQSEQSFVALANSTFGISRADALDLHQSVSSQVFDLGFKADCEPTQDPFDAVADKARLMISRMALNEMGRKLARLVLGSFIVLALPEFIGFELGVLLVAAVVAVANYGALRDFVEGAMKTIFDGITKGILNIDLPSE